MPLTIFIVGAGPAGLALATQLARIGHQVTLFERSSHRGGVGFAFTLTKNATRCLAQTLGLDPVEGGAVKAQGIKHFAHTGEDHGVMDMEDTVFCFRAGLLNQLYDVAIATGVHVRESTRVVSVDPATTSLVLSTDERLKADLIVGADGVHSVVRPAISSVPPFPTTGRNAIRFVVPVSQLQADPDLATIVVGSGWNVSWNGPGRRFVIAYPCDYGQLVNIACLYPEELSDSATAGSDAAIDYALPVTKELLASIFADFEPRVQRLFALADPADLRAWKLLDLDELPAWRAGRVTLVGDAAHAVLPVSFQGTCMALEDAGVLGTLLPADARVEDLEERLDVYEALRRARVARVREYGRNARNTMGEVADYVAFLTEADPVEEARAWLERKRKGPGETA